MKKTIATLRKKDRRNVNLKCAPDEIAQIQKKADKFARGNLSAWVRYASLNFVPSPDDFS